MLNLKNFKIICLALFDKLNVHAEIKVKNNVNMPVK